MPIESDPLASLAPLFAAERQRRLAGLEQGVSQLSGAERRQERPAAIDSMARDAHSLKGPAQFEPRSGGADARVALCELVGELEEYLAAAPRVTAPPGERAGLLAALAVMGELSEGRVLTADLVRARAGLQAIRAAARRRG